MGRGACDLVMGYAQGTSLIEDTNPYYYTSYVLIYREDDSSLAGVESVTDPRLKGKRIGFFARTPPSSVLAIHGLTANAKSFEIHAGESATKAAVTMLDEIATGALDAGILWGPVGGYYAQRSQVPLTLIPLVKETAGPAHHLRHHLGRATGRPAVEALDQCVHRLERGRDQRHPAEL